jgi:hypothetical protein
VCQKRGSRQFLSWILIANNSVSMWLANLRGIQQADYLIQTIVLKVAIGCIQNSIYYGTGIICVVDILIILHLLLNLHCTFVCFLLVCNGLVQLFQCTLCTCGNTPVLLKFIAILDVSQTSNHWNEYLWMEYNQFYSFN